MDFRMTGAQDETASGSPCRCCSAIAAAAFGAQRYRRASGRWPAMREPATLSWWRRSRQTRASRSTASLRQLVVAASSSSPLHPARRRPAVKAARVASAAAAPARADGKAAHLAGLLHDVGKLVLSLAFGADALKAISAEGATAVRKPGLERERLGVDHAYAGHCWRTTRAPARQSPPRSSSITADARDSRLPMRSRRASNLPTASSRSQRARRPTKTCCNQRWSGSSFRGPRSTIWLSTRSRSGPPTPPWRNGASTWSASPRRTS